jgi:hypothetical protein
MKLQAATRFSGIQIYQFKSTENLSVDQATSKLYEAFEKNKSRSTLGSGSSIGYKGYMLSGLDALKVLRDLGVPGVALKNSEAANDKAIQSWWDQNPDHADRYRTAFMTYALYKQVTRQAAKRTKVFELEV